MNFNALPQAEKPKKKLSPASVLLPIVIVLGIGGIFYMYNLGRNAEARNELLRSQLVIIQRQLPEQQAVKTALEEQLAEIEPQLEPIKAEADGFNIMFSNLREGTERIDHEVTQIAHLPPEDVALVYGGDGLVGYATMISEATITHSGEMATVTGRTQNLASIFQYARDLRASGGFSEVTISSIAAYEEVLEAEEGDDEEEIIKGYNFRFILVQ